MGKAWSALALVLGFELERIIHRCIIHVLYRIIPSVPRRGRIVRIELRIELEILCKNLQMMHLTLQSLGSCEEALSRAKIIEKLTASQIYMEPGPISDLSFRAT